MESPSSASLKVKKSGLLHRGQLKLSPPTVTERPDAGAPHKLALGTALPAKERAALGAEFDRIEREETVEGLHEKYEGAINRLADKYVHGAGHVR